MTNFKLECHSSGESKGDVGEADVIILRKPEIGEIVAKFDSIVTDGPEVDEIEGGDGVVLNFGDFKPLKRRIISTSDTGAEIIPFVEEGDNTLLTSEERRFVLDSLRNCLK